MKMLFEFEAEFDDEKCLKTCKHYSYHTSDYGGWHHCNLFDSCDSDTPENQNPNRGSECLSAIKVYSGVQFNG